MAYPFRTLYTNQNPTFLGQTWTEDNPNAKYPRMTNSTQRAAWNYQNNDFMLQNSRYIRLKTLVVGYTLPQVWTRKVKLEKIRVYFSGNDLWKQPVFVTVSIRDGSRFQYQRLSVCPYMVVRTECYFIICIQLIDG